MTSHASVYDVLCEGSASSRTEASTREEGMYQLSNPDKKLKTRAIVGSKPGKKPKKLARCLSPEAIASMQSIWDEYLAKLLKKSKSPSDTLVGLSKADLHGSSLRIVQSRSPCLVGLQGTVIKETRDTLTIVSADGCLSKTLKKHNVFLLTSKGTHFRALLYGRQLSAKPSGRSTKKLKGNATTVEL